MKLTRIDLNSWILQIADQTILIDPWLVDPLVFYGQPWLFSLCHTNPPAFTPATLPPIDLILITQGLDDHCHKPTLEQLDRTIPAVASPTATQVLKNLGYSSITSLSNWQEFNQNNLQIIAVPGAEIQPGQIENGYLIKDLTNGETVYYEPHQSNLEVVEPRLGKIDVAIAPVVGQIFPFLGEIIMGPIAALNFVQTLKPQYIVPNALGDIQASGILPMFIRTVGSLEEFRDRLIASGLGTQLLTPTPGETIEISLTGLIPN
ncbi:MBL fold metallo-hydrolase [Oscillatoriales cyanobacterium USR001]|nr:MBL fold metallo-hydrolase [Oscillatoriales cyanobacterium USR001]